MGVTARALRARTPAGDKHGLEEQHKNSGNPKIGVSTFRQDLTLLPDDRHTGRACSCARRDQRSATSTMTFMAQCLFSSAKTSASSACSSGKWCVTGLRTSARPCAAKAIAAGYWLA